MDYRVDYRLYRLDRLVKSGTFIVRNCSDDFHAKLKLDKYLSKKYDYDQMVADAKKEDPSMDIFNTIFGKNWQQ